MARPSQPPSGLGRVIDMRTFKELERDSELANNALRLIKDIAAHCRAWLIEQGVAHTGGDVVSMAQLVHTELLCARDEEQYSDRMAARAAREAAEGTSVLR